MYILYVYCILKTKKPSALQVANTVVLWWIVYCTHPGRSKVGTSTSTSMSTATVKTTKKPTAEL